MSFKKLTGLTIVLSYVLMMIITSFGCLEREKETISETDYEKETTSETDYEKETISETHDDIIYKYDECKTLTTLQCIEWIKSYNGKYVKWNGIIYDVNSNIVVVSSNKASIGIIILYDIPKEKLVRLNKDDKITFTGKIVIENNYNDEMYRSLIYGNIVNLKLYNVKIE